MQRERSNTSDITHPMATTSDGNRRARRVNVRYDWQGKQRERCFRVIDGDLSPCECPAYVNARGLGDVVASATKAVGIKPCGACAKRQAAMNHATPGWVGKILAWVKR
jgi:hypothetical protein